MGISCVDGITPVPIRINVLNGGMMVDYVSTISFAPDTVANRDANSVPVRLAQNASGPGVLPIYVNPVTGGVLIAD